MRIDELRPSEIRSWRGQKSPTAMHQALTAKGFEEAGSGTYSDTYVKPGSNVLLKVTKKPDPCWIKFSEYVRKNPNPHFPKIGKVKRLHEGGKAYFVVFMEKLDPINNVKNVDLRLLRNALFDAHYAMHENDWEGVMQNDPNTDLEEYTDLIQLKREAPSFVEALDELYRNLPEDCLPDLHGGNVMTRNGVPVVIDPYMD